MNDELAAKRWKAVGGKKCHLVAVPGPAGDRLVAIGKTG